MDESAPLPPKFMYCWNQRIFNVCATGTIIITNTLTDSHMKPNTAVTQNGHVEKTQFDTKK